MPNPFFSARIPPDLFEKIEQHIAETGESKTQILIQALATYVNHPIQTQEVSVSKGISIEMFTALEERVAALEQLLKTPKEFVINIENSSNQGQEGNGVVDASLNENNVISVDNDTDFLDPWLDTSTPISSVTPNNAVIKLNSDTLLLAPAASESIHQVDNADNATKNTEPQQPELFDMPQGSIGPYSELRMAEELGINRNKLRRHLERIEKGQIPPDTPLEATREGQIYHARYLGKPHGRKLWMATPVEPDF